MPKEISKANQDVTVHTTKFISATGTGPYVISVEDVISGGVANLSDVTPGMIVTDASGSYVSVISL